ncbi:hypothetical protein C2869_01220 [Saccharobesus litoralis]|uniref:Uncharacterized protein n=1 Tax=Saccharobesus litoralis TaxID=2172099 RepID=A0A2S0VLR7_9ALTE|nr:hypothetical protein [Saccharobesus litoralis]AWB65146.1 hypothetical protein C2869_01220 [Saccharobesus litoralis]
MRLSSIHFLYSFCLILFGLIIQPPVHAHQGEHVSESYLYQKNWLKVPEGLDQIGKSHGEIAVSSAGDVYVSMMGKKGGIQVYSDQGQYIGNVTGAPDDIHGFAIRKEGAQDYIYGARLYGQTLFKMTLAGDIIFEIDAKSAIPKQFHNQPNPNKKWQDERKLKLTAVAVADNGDMYVVDGYGRDFIHKFNANGQYLDTFAGRQAPWKLKNCHKIAIDPRFTPNRILCADRANMRLVHIGLDGNYIGEYATNLRRPSAMSFYQNTVAVAEIGGRVTLLNKSGQVMQTIGTNQTAGQKESHHPKTPPEKWRDGVFTSPHGITFDANGNLLITEYSNYGRVLKFELNQNKLAKR